MNGFKGLDKDFKCNGFQYKVGEKYKHDGEARLCNSGFHFCEHPLDVLGYYNSRFAEVEADGVTEEKDIDTKRVCKAIHIKTEITLSALVGAAIKFVFDRADWSKKENHATGDSGAASATGNRGAASATGYRGAALATGYSGAASATGYSGAASATGYSGASSATGYSGAASATGYSGAASATGDSGAASATGYRGAALATGDSGAASATGYSGAASATGNSGAASATGYSGAASATGDRGAALATGDSGAASATGKHSIACGLGVECKAMGAVGCWIVLAERKWKGNEWVIKTVKTAKVDGKKIKADRWYMLKNGKIVEVK
jgi:hypothetical protein